MFEKEADFEEALVQLLLSEKGWQEVLTNLTEQDLIKNWAQILFENNRDIDRLNNQPLTDGEMQQIIEQINTLKTPLRLNGFINGKSVAITEIDTGMIDTDYMNSRFEKYLKTRGSSDAKAESEALNDLHKTFATLTQDEQKYANIFLRDIQRGDVEIEDGKPLRDYITAYQMRAKNARIAKVSEVFGLDQNLLRELMKSQVTDANVNEFGRFDRLTSSIDKAKAKAYFEKIEGATVSAFDTSIKPSKLLRDFVLNGGFELTINEGTR